MRLISTQTVGDSLALLTYERVRTPSGEATGGSRLAGPEAAPRR